MSTGSRRDGPGCRKARPRLPLLAGGELTGEDRRGVEQHLITCDDCRARLDSTRESLRLLRAVGGFERAEGQEAPSLWPAIQRQIVEAKHAPRPSALARLGAWVDGFFFPPDPRRLAVAGALGLAVLAAAGVSRWADRQTGLALDAMAEARRPLPTDLTVRRLPLPPDAGPVLADVSTTPPGLADAVAPRFDYDLDHGTPMDPDARDAGDGAY